MVALISADEVAELLDANPADPKLKLIVRGVNAAATQKRALLRDEFTHTVQGYGKNVVVLPESPIVELAEVRVDCNGAFGDDTVVSDLTQFAWNPDEREDNPFLYWNGGVFPEAPFAARITYTAGFETLPDDLALELIAEAMERYRGNFNERKKSESMGSYSYTNFDGVEPKRAAVFRRYRMI